MNPKRMSHTETARPAGKTLRAAFVGSLAGLAMAIVDVAFAGGPSQLNIRAFALVLLAGLWVPIGLLFALAVRGLRGLINATGWLSPFRLGEQYLFSPTPSPERFASTLGMLVFTATLILGTHRWISYSFEHFHAANLIAWFIAGGTLAVVIVATVVAAATQHIGVWLGRLIGSLASPLFVVLVLVAGIAAVLAFSLQPLRQLSQGVPVLEYGFMALLPVAFVLLHGVNYFLNVSRRISWAVVATLLAVSVYTMFGYGHSRMPRNFVDSRTLSGPRTLHLFASTFDLDGDGYASLYGGGDCDDGNAQIHPGALDTPGDGIDADCFAGDGAPSAREFLGHGDYAPTLEAPSRHNVVLIMVDALRPDHLGTFGYDRPLSPEIDRFAAESVVFRNALAASSRSIRSIPAMFTGLYASQIQYGPQYVYPALLPSNRLLAEVARDEGYRTIACMGTRYFEMIDGFFQGFDEVIQLDPLDRTAPASCAEEALARQHPDDPPFLLWVYLFNVHVPYLPDDPHSPFGDSRMDKYDREVQLADVEVRRVLDATPEDSIVVLLSDHGEGFGEHGNQGHSTTLYEEEIQSTFMIRAPGVSPRRVEALVSLVDLAPTLKNMLGIGGRPQISGRSLVPFLLGHTPEHWSERPFLMELLPDGRFPFDRKGIRVGDHKLVWWVRDGTTRFVDLSLDPGEHEDSWQAHRTIASGLFDRLRAWTAYTRSSEHDVHLLDSIPANITRLDLRYPGFDLVGYETSPHVVRHGDTIDFTFYFRVRESQENDLMVQLIFLDSNGDWSYDFDGNHYPVNGSFRTHHWQPGQIIADGLQVIVGNNVPPDQYNVTLSLVHGNSRQNVAFEHEGESGRERTLSPFRVRERLE